MLINVNLYIISDINIKILIVFPTAKLGLRSAFFDGACFFVKHEVKRIGLCLSRQGEILMLVWINLRLFLLMIINF